MRLLSAFFLLTFSVPAFSSLGINCEQNRCGFFQRKEKLINFKPVAYSLDSHIVLKDEAFHDGALKIKNVDNSDAANYIAAIALITSICLPLYFNFSQKKRSFRAEFFSRQVLYPEYVKPLLNFVFWLHGFKNASEVDDIVATEFDRRFQIQLQGISAYNSIMRSVEENFDSRELNKSLEDVQDAFLNVYVFDASSQSADYGLACVKKMSDEILNFNKILFKSLE